MIAKRWLVQSSAVGLFGAAVLSLPFWIDSETDSQDDQPRMSCCESATSIGEERSDHADEGLSETTVRVRSIEAKEVGQRTGEGVGETTRTVRVRYHLEDAYQGPMCPAKFDARPRDVSRP